VALCLGGDIAEVDAYPDPWQFRNRRDYCDALRALRKPVIAAVNGYAYGGGLELALSCDIRLASATASFAAADIKLGWIGGGGVSALLTASVPASDAALLLLTGDPVDAAEAHRIGLVSRVYSPGGASASGAVAGLDDRRAAAGRGPGGQGQPARRPEHGPRAGHPVGAGDARLSAWGRATPRRDVRPSRRSGPLHLPVTEEERRAVQIIRYAGPDGVRVAVTGEAGPRVLPVASVAELLSMPLDRMRSVVEASGEPAGGPAGGPAGWPAGGPLRPLPPVDGLTEVWACGVTYERSSEARQEESDVADVYARVYQADRPELFFKSPAWRVCGDGEPIGIRPDSEISVPEPELALVCNAAAEIVGVTICDDVSSRSIEGQNPLYLPQAKIYAGACAIGPGITPVWTLDDIGALTITVSVRRGESVVWSGETSTAQLHRDLADLVEYLFRSFSFPQGVILSTGTGLVPELSFTLAPGDEVAVGIAGVGTLTNVVRLTTGFGWLTPSPDRSPGGA
jgi:2-dehydro-3-deoxy-D-arabinonate dehydratase